MRRTILFLFVADTAALFVNPFADLLRQAPISLAKRNFALPRHPDLVTLNADPPVYEVPGFMSEAECQELVAAAEAGRFPPIPYGTKNRIFTGTKWAAAGDPMVAPFLERCCKAWNVPATRFEPITVTRYAEGQYQAQHLDARLKHQVQRDAQYFKTGGQRIAQLIVYLQPPEAGGETRFFEKEFNGLACQPEVGKALVFPVASLDGEADERYLHSGEPVLAGTKWILGTWLMEVERSDAADIRSSIDELWKLAGGRPAGVKPAAKAAGGGVGARKPAAPMKAGKKKKR